MLLDLAAAHVTVGQVEHGLATLARFAALGLHAPIDTIEEFAPLRGGKEYQEVVKKLSANAQPRGNAEIGFTLRDVTGLIEGIAWREKTGEFFFGDVHSRAVWVRGKDEKLRRFTPEDEALPGVFGLVVDEAGGTLWAAVSAVEAMRGFSPELEGTAGLVEIDLASGSIRNLYPAKSAAGEHHLLGDLALTDDGSVVLTDSRAPVLWRLPPGGRALEPAIESPEFFSLQGVAVLPGGTIVVSDQVSGLLRVDLARREVQRIALPENTTLVGIDGLVPRPDGSLVAFQRGVRPVRVLNVRFAEDAVGAVRVLEAGHLNMAAPSTGCMGPAGDVFFIGNPGWNRFQANPGQPSAPRPIPVFRIRRGQ